MWAAYTGTTSLRGSDSGAVKMGIARIIPHPSYNADTADYDVAVLELKRPVTFTKYIQPVCLPDTGHHFPTSKKCLISGWGYLKEDFCKQRVAGGRGGMVGCKWCRRHGGGGSSGHALASRGGLPVPCKATCSELTVASVSFSGETRVPAESNSGAAGPDAVLQPLQPCPHRQDVVCWLPGGENRLLPGKLCQGKPAHLPA